MMEIYSITFVDMFFLFQILIDSFLAYLINFLNIIIV